MSLKLIFSDICEKLGDAKHISKQFYDLKSDEDRFKFTHDICINFIVNQSFQRVKKSQQRSLNLGRLAHDCFHKNRKWDGLKYSNERIASAVPDTEELGTAFDQRSDFLFELGFPEEAATDNNRALSLLETESLKQGVLPKRLRKTQSFSTCLISNGEILPLSSEKSTYFDSASKFVGLLYDDYWERQLVAEGDLKTGEVLMIEKPYSSVLVPSHLYTHCSNCFKRSLNLQPCNSCCFAMFCSPDCQKKSWDDYHHIECSILDVLIELKAERMELLSLRILLCATQQGKNLEKLYQEIKQFEDSQTNNSKNFQFYKSLDFINIFNLITNSDRRSASDLFYRSVISVILIHLLEKYTTFFNSVPENNKELYKVFCGGLILRFMQSLPCNAHEISELTDMGLQEIGAGVYATLSLINHSCDPNVVRYSCGDVMVLRTIKPIKKGEQIFDNYGYHYATHPPIERQDALMKQYYFKCSCEACVQHWLTYEGLPGNKPHFKKKVNMTMYNNLTAKFEENLSNTFEGNFNSQTIAENMKYLDFLHEFVELPWQNFNKCQEALKHCWSFSGNHFRNSKAVIL